MIAAHPDNRLRGACNAALDIEEKRLERSRGAGRQKGGEQIGPRIGSVLYIDLVETGKLVSHVLKDAFPGIKFSTRSKRGLRMSGIDIEWMDGPTREQVWQVVQPFEGAEIDPLTDIVWQKKGELNGELVQFAADYIHLDRHYSQTFLAEVAALVTAEHGLPLTAVVEASWWIDRS